MNFNAPYDPNQVKSDEDFFANAYYKIEDIIRNELRRFKNNYDKTKFIEDEYVLIEKSKKDKKEYKTYINHFFKLHEASEYEFRYKLGDPSDVDLMLRDVAEDIRTRLQSIKILSNLCIIKEDKIKIICASQRDYTTHKNHMIYTIIIGLSTYMISKQYRFVEKSRNGRSRSTTRSKEEEDFEMIRPKMCLFDLMYNYIDVYLDELPACVEYNPNKRQRTD